ncbi:MAG: glycosyltransferase family A protein [Verrucomicrobiota bacterium]
MRRVVGEATFTTDKKDWMPATFELGLVSVIIPLYNRPQLIIESLDSLRKQTYRPIEVCVVDDGSGDDSLDRLEAWAKVYEREDFRIITRRQHNQGAPAARNHGVRLSQGEFIMFMDSDDTLEPQALEWAVERLQANPADPFVYFRVQVGDEHLRPICNWTVGQPYENDEGDVTRYLWHTMGPVYRRRVVREVGPWSTWLRGSQDWEYAARVKLAGFRGHFDKRISGTWRHHKGPRIGAQKFRYDYVLAVEQACERVRDIAAEQDELNPRVAKTLARRLLIHALELGQNKRITDRNRFVQTASDLPVKDMPTRLLTRLLQLNPSATLDRVFYRALKRKG